MTILDDTLAAIRADAEALEVAAVREHLTNLTSAPDAVLVQEIAWSLSIAAPFGGVAVLAAEDYEHDRHAYSSRYRDALWCSARLHNAGDLWPLLTCTDMIHLPAVRVERGWEVLDEGTWRVVAAEPVLVGDGEDEDGGRVELLLGDLGPAVYRRGEKVWARDRAKYAAILATLDETAGEGVDGA